MTTSAIVMMAISIVLVWGGLIAAILHLRRHPEKPESE
ncbi:methionine/alanine import family NSS transporter small subunit [Nocardiopsis synnemataformans]